MNKREIILIEAGASIVNLLLVNNQKNKKIIVLCNNNMYSYHGIYEDILRFYFKDVNVIIGNVDKNIGEGKAYVNEPFHVNVNEIKSLGEKYFWKRTI